MKREISVAYSKDELYWQEAFDLKQIYSIDDIYKKNNNGKLIIECITYICFVSNMGILIEAEKGTFFYSLQNPGPEILEHLCQANLFGPKANAKMWYCAFKYSLENKSCIAFWEKYKHTNGGSKFMSLMLGQKETLDNN